MFKKFYVKLYRNPLAKMSQIECDAFERGWERVVFCIRNSSKNFSNKGSSTWAESQAG